MRNFAFVLLVHCRRTETQRILDRHLKKTPKPKGNHFAMSGSTGTGKKLSRAWDALTPPLAEWIIDAVSSMGYPQATPVQKATFDFFRGNKDVVVEVRCFGRGILYYICLIVSDFLPGRNWKWENPCLPYSHRRATSAHRRASQETPCKSDRYIPNPRAGNANIQSSRRPARLSPRIRGSASVRPE